MGIYTEQPPGNADSLLRLTEGFPRSRCLGRNSHRQPFHHQLLRSTNSCFNFLLVLDEEEDDEPLVVPQLERPTTDDHPTAEELLRELWWLVGKAILLLTLNLNDFFVGNPCLDWFSSRGHSRSGSLTHSYSALRTRAISCPAAWPSASGSSTIESRRPPVVVDTIRHEQQNRICELEDEVKTLASEIQEMRRRELPPVPSAPAVMLATPRRPQFPREQPVFRMGSASPLPPPQHFGPGYRPPPQHAPLNQDRVPNGAAGSSWNQSILYDAKVTPVPNKPEMVHLKFIQGLHADGISRGEIHRRTLNEFLDLCKGGTDEARKARVWTTVDMNTSRWADKYV